MSSFISMSNQNFSDALNQEVSSIKPDLGTGQKERKEPRFTYRLSIVQFCTFRFAMVVVDSILSRSIIVRKQSANLILPILNSRPRKPQKCCNEMQQHIRATRTKSRLD